MKKFLTIMILILVLYVPSYASQDIRNLQVEGISVGDKLSKYYSLESQKKMKATVDEKTNLVTIVISDPSFVIYDQVQVVFIKKNQKILSIEGIHYGPYDFCLQQKNFVVKDILKLFAKKKYEVIDEKEKKHPADIFGQSKFTNTHIDLKDSNGSINVRCYKWSKKLTQEKGWIDSLSVSINSKRIKTLKKIVNIISEPLPILSDPNFEFALDEKYYALLIGNNDYEYWEKLDAPVNDVVELGKILETKYGYKVDVVKNANENVIRTKLIELSKKVTSEDNLLIYYSGHGDRNINMSPIRAYWIPTDAAQTFDAKWINTEDVSAMISQISAKHILIMVDSCYAGSSIRGASSNSLEEDRAFQKKLYEEEESWGKSTKNYTKNYIKKMLNRRTRIAITSGNIEPVVDSYIQKHSLFAYKFLNILKQNENYISSMDLFAQLNKYIISASSQSPQMYALNNMGHNDGQFFFIVKN